MIITIFINLFIYIFNFLCCVELFVFLSLLYPSFYLCCVFCVLSIFHDFCLDCTDPLI
jgi:hypothetical protein